jgi:hypothetical protein
VRAQARFRDFDGRVRAVTRFGRSRAEDERRLRTALRDRAGSAEDSATADSRLSTVATAWSAQIDASDLAAGTERLYRFAVTSYVLPGAAPPARRPRQPSSEASDLPGPTRPDRSCGTVALHAGLAASPTCRRAALTSANATRGPVAATPHTRK